MTALQTNTTQTTQDTANDFVKSIRHLTSRKYKKHTHTKHIKPQMMIGIGKEIEQTLNI